MRSLFGAMLPRAPIFSPNSIALHYELLSGLYSLSVCLNTNVLLYGKLHSECSITLNHYNVRAKLITTEDHNLLYLPARRSSIMNVR